MAVRKKAARTNPKSDPKSKSKSASYPKGTARTADSDPSAQADYGGLVAIGCRELDRGRLDKARAALSRAVELRPDGAHALANLGEAIRRGGRPEEALAYLERARDAAPDASPPWLNLGVCLRDLKRLDEARSAFEEAARLDPKCSPALTHWGEMLSVAGRKEEALAVLERAIAVDPRAHRAINLMGLVKKELGDGAGACACFERALALPDKSLEEESVAWLNLAVAKLAEGDFPAGWAAFEKRFLLPILDPVRPERFSGRRWMGEDLKGRTIAVYGEQGYGDAIQFARYVPLLAARGAHVQVGIFPELEALFGTLPGAGTIVRGGEAFPKHDFHSSLVSLPHAFGTVLSNVPAPIPYLFAKPEAAGAWRVRMADLAAAAGRRWDDGVLRTGIVWAGNPDLQDDKDRSVRLELLGGLLRLPGFSFASLQYGSPRDQIAGIDPEIRPLDPMGEAKGFEDTAAVLDGLDLVVCVDTAVAHLAGAMGKPVLLLSRKDGCWRWLQGREDSPWYPTMRLLRLGGRGEAAWLEAAGRAARILEGARDGGRPVSLFGGKEPSGAR